MNKKDFLSRLRTALAPLPEEERDAAMSYYEEFFSDAGEDNEQSVISSLGAPEELARSIIDENNRENPAYNKENSAGDTENPAYNAENPANNTENSGFENNGGYAPPPAPVPVQSGKWSNGQIVLFIVLAVLSSPIWLGLLAAVIGVIVGIFVTIISVIGAIGACAVTFLAAGIAALFQEPALGLMMIGFAFIFAGLFPLAIVPLCKLAVKGIKALVKAIEKLFNKFTGKGNVQ